jgi:pilus assembly protein Flp/PilA
MATFINRFARSRSGATAVEYAILATCIALAIIVAVANLGTNLNAMYVQISTAFN